MKQTIKITFFIFYILCSKLLAQTPFYYRINTADGLTTNKIYDITEDLKGFYWIGSDNGIYKYDGVVLKKIDSKKAGVNNINHDKKNRIWYQDFDGYIYFIENNKKNVLKNIYLKGFLEYGMTSQYIYFPEHNHISFINLNDITEKKVIKISTKGINKTFVYNDYYGFLTENNLHFITPNKHSKFSLTDEFKNDIKTPLVTILENTIYIFDKYKTSSFYTFKDGVFTKNSLDIPINFIQNLSSYDNDIWISSTSGLLRYNVVTKQSKYYFENNNISQIYKDKENHYWVTTLTDGFLFIKSFNDKIFAINGNPVVLSKFHEKLIVGTEDDKILALDNSSSETIVQSNHNHAYLTLQAFENSNTILATSSSFKWIENQKILQSQISVKDVAQLDSDNFAFVASKISGIVTNNPKKHEENKLRFPNAQQSKIDQLYFTYFQLEENGRNVAYNPMNKTIYYATKIGLFKVVNGKIYSIKNLKNEEIILNKLYIYKDDLIGFTIENQLIRINQNKKITSIPLPNYVAESSIRNIKLINNSLFIGANNGIYELDLIRNKFSKILNLSASFTVSDIEEIGSNLYFATNEGILKKDRINLSTEFIPKLTIDEVLSNGKIIDLAEQNTLNYSSNNIQINFSISSKIPNEIYNISYQINENKWIEIDQKTRMINLSSLAHGEYTIRLKIEGDFEKAQIEDIKITIKKPFWQTNLFLIFSILSALSLSYYLAKIYIKRLKKINQTELNQINLKNELNSQKLISLKSQMNPHFFYNALNTLQSYIITNDKKMALFYLSKFSQLTRHILNLSEKDFITLDVEIKTNETYLQLEKVRFNDDFEYYIETDPAIDLIKWKFPALLLQPIIENSLKHGLLHRKNEKKLWIKINQNDSYLIVSIIDNGIGRKASEEINKNRKNHNSFATKATINRISILNQSYNIDISVEYIDLYDENGKPKGTQVDVKLLKQSYESNHN